MCWLSAALLIALVTVTHTVVGKAATRAAKITTPQLLLLSRPRPYGTAVTVAAMRRAGCPRLERTDASERVEL
ncbi:hypothetical protein BC826DRAFT_1038654 [Russula brevipes]|nr:hypothetical protein BC826DRAFT_1038654 [Russula brevipes]